MTEETHFLFSILLTHNNINSKKIILLLKIKYFIFCAPERLMFITIYFHQNMISFKLEKLFGKFQDLSFDTKSFP